MSDTTDKSQNLGVKSTIPGADDGLAGGRDPDRSAFNSEEDDTSTTDADALPDGSGTDAEASTATDDDTDTASGGDAD